MANRQLTDDERQRLIGPLLESVRISLRELAAGDEDLLFALRRKLFKELTYDERGKPMLRRALKNVKRKEQSGLCAICMKLLPERDSVLDRFHAIAGYTKENTRLICRPCDLNVQTERGFS